MKQDEPGQQNTLKYHETVRSDTGHQLYKFDTNRIANSNMADKMAAVQGYGHILSVYISFQVL